MESFSCKHDDKDIDCEKEIEKIDEMLASSAIEKIFDNYSSKINSFISKYNSKSKELEEEVGFDRQFEQLNEQMKLLEKGKHLLNYSNRYAEKDNDASLQTYDNKFRGKNEQTPTRNQAEKESDHRLAMMMTSSHDVSGQLLCKQLELSVELADKFKALALDSEQKLQRKLDEETRMKERLAEVSSKEAAAKLELAAMVDQLLRERSGSSGDQLLRVRSADQLLRERYGSSRDHFHRKRSGSSEDQLLHEQTGSSGQLRMRRSSRQQPLEGDVDFSFHHRAAPSYFQPPVPCYQHPPGPCYQPSSTSRSRNVKERKRADSRRHDGGDNRAPRNDSANRMPRSRYDQLIIDQLVRPPIVDDDVMTNVTSSSCDEMLVTRDMLDARKVVPFSNLFGRRRPSLKSEVDRKVALLLVFERLPAPHLLRCALVCREWRDVSRAPRLWHRVALRNLRVAPQLLKLMSRWTASCCSITLHDVTAMTSSTDRRHATTGSLEHGLEALLRSCGGNLLQLSIENCDPALTCRSLWIVSCYNRKIRSITYKSRLDPLNHQVAWSLGAACRDLVSMEIAPRQPCESPQLFDNHVIKLLTWCFPNLQALSYGGSKVDGDSLLAVALNCRQLKVLELEHHSTRITRRQAHTACLHGLRELHTLLLNRSPVDAATAHVFLQQLATANLRLLHVSVSHRDYQPRGGAAESQSCKIRTRDLKTVNALRELCEEYPKVFTLEVLDDK